MFHSCLVLFVPLWLLVVLCRGGYGEDSVKAKPLVRDDTPDADGWGETVDGLRMRLSAPERSIVLGDKFRLRIELDVVGATALTVTEPTVEGEIDIQGQLRIWPYKNYNTVIFARTLPVQELRNTPEDDISTDTYKAAEACLESLPGAPRPVKPGLRLQQELLVFWSMQEYVKPLGREDVVSPEASRNYISAGRVAFLATKAGAYEVWATYRIDKTNSDLKKKDAWTGELKSKPIRLEVTKDKREDKPEDSKGSEKNAVTTDKRDSGSECQ